MGLLAFGLFIFLDSRYKMPTGDLLPHTVIIPPRTSLNEIAVLLKQEKIIHSFFHFICNARLRQMNKSLKAGEYFFPAKRSIKSVIKLLVSGKTMMHKFTAIEGQTSAEIVKELNLAQDLQGEIQPTPLEGTLFPQTYYYSFNDQRGDLIKRMQTAREKSLKILWQGRDLSLPLVSPQDALILASIVEKETCLPQERPHVAGVFYKRLTLKMRLQSDPTLLYGLHLLSGLPLNRDLRRNELVIDHPYNTYLYEGLPPTPICNPSNSALQAVLHPQKTDDLYFVTDGSGGHIFSSTYDEHKRHHQALRIRRLETKQNSLPNQPLNMDITKDK